MRLDLAQCALYSDRMFDLRAELLEAMQAKGYTFGRLKEESGLTVDLGSLNRKLHGEQAIDAHEAQALAKVLGIRSADVTKATKLAKDLGGAVVWAKRARAS